jgi:hypothetical protein
MSRFKPSFPAYLLATWTYGLIRTTPHYYDRETKFLNTKLAIVETRQMLWSEKACNILFFSVIAPYTWPGYLANDVALLKLLLRREDPQDHGFDQNWETSGPFDD